MRSGQIDEVMMTETCMVQQHTVSYIKNVHSIASSLVKIHVLHDQTNGVIFSLPSNIHSLIQRMCVVIVIIKFNAI